MSREDEIRARLNAGTQGRWRYASANSASHGVVHDLGGICKMVDHACPGQEQVAEANAIFIAHCGGDDGDVAYLLAEVDRLNIRVANLETWNEARADRLAACRDLAAEFERKAKDLRSRMKGRTTLESIDKERLTAKASIYEAEARNLRAAIEGAP